MTLTNYFNGNQDEVQTFRKSEIHSRVFEFEGKDMGFARWIRNMDAYSFLYTYFLNPRGVISKNSNAVKETSSKPAETTA